MLNRHQFCGLDSSLPKDMPKKINDISFSLAQKPVNITLFEKKYVIKNIDNVMYPG